MRAMGFGDAERITQTAFNTFASPTFIDNVGELLSASPMVFVQCTEPIPYSVSVSACFL